MKIISLNIWGGFLKKPLLDFILKYRDTDFFCFQEVYYKALSSNAFEERKVSLDILSEIQEVLPLHTALFSPSVSGVFGLAMLIKSHLTVFDYGEAIVHQNLNFPDIGPYHSRNLQWIKCAYNSQNFGIANVHGLWHESGKKDSPNRITQAQNIKKALNNLKMPHILCGDLNLTLHTKSLQILDSGMKNCITKYGIRSTRTKYYQKKDKYADYMILSNEFNVNEFKVLQDEVSDHAPLFLDFELGQQ